MNNFSRIFGFLLILVVIINFAGVASAQNKVVVVPLGGEDYKDPTNGLRTLLFDAVVDVEACNLVIDEHRPV